MDYEKIHKDTLTKLQEMVNSGKITAETARGICADFVSESEDEMIRKELLNAFQESEDSIYIVLTPHRRELFIAWLEKQGEQKDDEIHPIFRVGDYIRNKKTSDKVLIEQLDIATKSYCYVSYDGAAEIHSDFPFVKQDEWKLIGQKVVEQNPSDEIGNYNHKEVLQTIINEQKPAWSEEDERCLTNAIYACDQMSDEDYNHSQCYIDAIKWLKSIKDRVGNFDDGYKVGFSAAKHNQWTPSDEQINALDSTLQYLQVSHNSVKYISSLFNDLKKLKEE